MPSQHDDDDYDDDNHDNVSFWASLIWEAWETQEAYETQETKEAHEAQQTASHNPHLHPDNDVGTSGRPPTHTPGLI